MPRAFVARIGYLSISVVRHDPRTPSDWSTPATTRRWPHFRRVDPVLATKLPQCTRSLYHTTRKWLGRSTTQRVTTHHLSSPSSSLCYRRIRTRTICLMYGSLGHKPPRPLFLSPTKCHLSTAAVYRERSWATLPHPPMAQVLSWHYTRTSTACTSSKFSSLFTIVP